MAYTSRVKAVSIAELEWAADTLKELVMKRRNYYVRVKDVRGGQRARIVFGRLLAILHRHGLLEAMKTKRPLTYRLKPLVYEAIVKCSLERMECLDGGCECRLKNYCPWLLLHEIINPSG